MFVPDPNFEKPLIIIDYNSIISYYNNYLDEIRNPDDYVTHPFHFYFIQKKFNKYD